MNFNINFENKFENIFLEKSSDFEVPEDLNDQIYLSRERRSIESSIRISNYPTFRSVIGEREVIDDPFYNTTKNPFVNINDINDNSKKVSDGKINFEEILDQNQRHHPNLIKKKIQVIDPFEGFY